MSTEPHDVAVLFPSQEAVSWATIHWLRNVSTHRFLLQTDQKQANEYRNTQTDERRILPVDEFGALANQEQWVIHTPFDHVTTNWCLVPTFRQGMQPFETRFAWKPLMLLVHDHEGFVTTTFRNFIRRFLPDFEV